MIWGWVSVIEWNDVCDQWDMRTDWLGGVRAYFAAAPSFQRSLPHTLGFGIRVAAAGNCALYDPGILVADCLTDPYECMQCLDKGIECYDDLGGRWCEQDQVCVRGPPKPDGNPDRGICVALPPHGNVGPITLGGLRTEVTLVPDELDRYRPVGTFDLDDLFEDGAAVTAESLGGSYPAVSFQAEGVAPLALANNVVTLSRGQDAVARWTPGDPGTRVQVVLQAGSHDPNPLAAAILCDAPDADGQVVIGAALVDGYLALACDGAMMMKCSRITRYSRDLQSSPGKEIELFVGSARNLRMLIE